MRDLDATADQAVAPTVVDATWPDARGTAARAATVVGTELIGVVAAAGRLLATDLVARVALPTATTSAMDGWAVAGAGPWQVSGALAAGAVVTAPMPGGTAVEIGTGAVVPPGANVLRREDGRLRGALLEPRRPTAPGQDVRAAGTELSAGTMLAAAGARLTPPVLGLAAAAGHDTIVVRRRPRIAVLLLGDEVLTGGLPGGGRVRDAVGVQVPGWAYWCGAHVVSSALVPDDPEATTAAIQAAEADVVVSVGGTSAGSRDHVRPALVAAGGRPVVDGVRVRPGHPMLLAALPGQRWLVALPGNPGAAVAAVLTLLVPLVAGMTGRVAPDAQAVHSTHALSGGDAHRLVPAAPDDLETPDQLTPQASRGPAMLRGWAAASHALVVPPEGLVAGEKAEALALPAA